MVMWMCFVMCFVVFLLLKGEGRVLSCLSVCFMDVSRVVVFVVRVCGVISLVKVFSVLGCLVELWMMSMGCFRMVVFFWIFFEFDISIVVCVVSVRKCLYGSGFLVISVFSRCVVLSEVSIVLVCGCMGKMMG